MSEHQCILAPGAQEIVCAQCGARYARLPGVRCPRCGNEFAACVGCHGCVHSGGGLLAALRRRKAASSPAPSS